jgi:hypothetical protein
MSFLDLFDPPTRREASLQQEVRAAHAAARAAAVNAARSSRLRGLRDEASLDRLRAVIREQDQELAQLTLALTSLVDMLADAGAIDPWLLQARIAEATEALDADGDGKIDAPDRTALASPAKGLAYDPRTQGVCKNCKGVFPLAQLDITGSGTMCTRCSTAASY